ncbi:uncharacterized protein LOC122562368 [Chiloscyllium plagiosum]|uniref:uncharacterized protein LOC122562368 n=1 Tax=Chiloscyllium plagiosum TaxID=36176 RepID=UPI001CB87B41|nr:uncharacterized protein LOC122562368 [Chiloscyllium plagiosum]
MAQPLSETHPRDPRPPTRSSPILSSSITPPTAINPAPLERLHSRAPHSRLARPVHQSPPADTPSTSKSTPLDVPALSILPRPQTPHQPIPDSPGPIAPPISQCRPERGRCWSSGGLNEIIPEWIEADRQRGLHHGGLRRQDTGEAGPAAISEIKILCVNTQDIPYLQDYNGLQNQSCHLPIFPDQLVSINSEHLVSISSLSQITDQRSGHRDVCFNNSALPDAPVLMTSSYQARETLAAVSCAA